jgi:hypothetical protein
MHGLPGHADRVTEILVGYAVGFEIVGELHARQSVTKSVTSQPPCHHFGYFALSPRW